MGEEVLGQVLGLLGGMTPPPDVGVKGVPVGLAEGGEGLARGGSFGSPAAITRLQWVVGKVVGESSSDDAWDMTIASQNLPVG